MHDNNHIPYSQKGLEDLAIALGIDSAYLWVNPVKQQLDVKQDTSTPTSGHGSVELEESE